MILHSDGHLSARSQRLDGCSYRRTNADTTSDTTLGTIAGTKSDTHRFDMSL